MRNICGTIATLVVFSPGFSNTKQVIDMHVPEINLCLSPRLFGAFMRFGVSEDPYQALHDFYGRYSVDPPRSPWQQVAFNTMEVFMSVSVVRIDLFHDIPQPGPDTRTKAPPDAAPSRYRHHMPPSYSDAACSSVTSTDVIGVQNMVQTSARFNPIGARLIASLRLWELDLSYNSTPDATTIKTQCLEVDMQDCREVSTLLVEMSV